jgi:competence protein ComEC
MAVRRVIESGAVTGQVGQIAVLKEITEDSIPWLHARAGSGLEVDGVRLTFLYPDSGQSWDEPLKPNELSLVFLLEYGQFRMLFTGDISGAVEDKLGRELGDAVRAQVLKISHHGSRTSTSEYFLRTVDPELAVISVGRGNRYGHPSPRVLWRLSDRHVPLRRTDRDGTVVIKAKRDGSWSVRSAAEGY